MTKREVFGASITMLGETFNRQITTGLLDGYWTALEHLSAEEIKAAVSQGLAQCKFMPSPAELLAFARPPRNPAADAMKAWQAVRQAINKYDYLVGSIDFGPLVNAVIRNLGGWDTLCRATLPELDNPGWLRKRFEEVYRALCTSDAQGLNGEPLAGRLPPNYDAPIHAVVAIDGEPARPRLEASGAADARTSIAAHIRELANAKKVSNG